MKSWFQIKSKGLFKINSLDSKIQNISCISCSPNIKCNRTSDLTLSTKNFLLQSDLMKYQGRRFHSFNHSFSSNKQYTNFKKHLNEKKSSSNNFVSQKSKSASPYHFDKRKEIPSKGKSLKNSIKKERIDLQHSIQNGRSKYLDTLDMIESLDKKSTIDSYNLSQSSIEKNHISPNKKEHTTLQSTLNDEVDSNKLDSRISDLNSKNWYPFHMSRARNDIRNRVVDCYIQLLDSRCPFTSYNPSILQDNEGNNISKKNVTTICYKRDLGFLPNDVNQSSLILDTDLIWMDRFATRKEIGSFLSKIESSVTRRFKTIPIVSCVVGIPNVGKSSFINLLAKQYKAKKGDLPGVTKNITGFQVTNDLMVLDTPGILMPRIEADEDKMKLMLINAVSEKMVDFVDLTRYSLSVMNKKGFTEGYTSALGINQPILDSEELLHHIARKYSFKNGDELDLGRAAELWVRKFRLGEFGKIFLDDFPHEIQIKSTNFLNPTSFLNNITHISEWMKLNIEHVYIDSDSFVYMSQYTCKLKLLKRNQEIQDTLFRLTKYFAEICKIRRCNLIYSYVPSTLLKKNSIDAQIFIRDKGDFNSVHDNLISVSNQFGEVEEKNKRLFITIDNELAQQLLHKGYHVVHMGQWMQWMNKIIFKNLNIEDMIEKIANEEKLHKN